MYIPITLYLLYNKIERKVEAKYTYTTASNISPTREFLKKPTSTNQKIMAPLGSLKITEEFQGLRRESLKKLSMKTHNEISNLRKRSLKTHTSVPKNNREFVGERASKKINNLIIMKPFKRYFNYFFQFYF